MPVISAKNGKARWASTDISDVRSISLELDGAAKPFASSSTGGRMNRVSGNHDAKATLEIYLNTSTEFYDAFREGDIGVADFYQNATLFWTGSFMVESANINIPIEGGEPVSATVVLGGASATTTSITKPS